MNYYLAPLEGITTYIYRNAYHSIFYPMEKYFTPFIVPRMKRAMNSREINDILPEHNQGLFVVPQLLTNQAADFIKGAKVLEAYGYQEINLNLGCPSGTVVAKGKGAGFLAHPRELNRFLEEVFSSLTVEISIKTRIGMEDPEEFEPLLEIFNQYPLKELIIHPRVREDYYRHSPNFSVFKKALEKSVSLLCYNGDIFTKGDYEDLLKKFPSLPAVMLGRGVIADPGLRQSIEDKGQEKRKEQFQRFHGEVYQGYREILSGGRNVLFKMKELWSYLVQSFTDYEPYAKKIRKAGTLSEYETAVRALFREQEVISNGRFSF